MSSTYAVVMEELSRGYASVADQCGLIELIGTLLSTHGTSEAGRALFGCDDQCRTALRLRAHRSRSRIGSRRIENHRRQIRQRLGIDRPENSGSITRPLPISRSFLRARTAAGHRGMSIFIVDLNAPGCSRGKKEHKMGQRASQVGPLFFEKVKLPANALLGPRRSRLSHHDERAGERPRRHCRRSRSAFCNSYRGKHRLCPRSRKQNSARRSRNLQAVQWMISRYGQRHRRPRNCW